MPRINLLPVKAAKRRDTARNEFFLSVGLILATLIGLFLWYSDTESDITAMQVKLQALEANLGKLGKEIEQVKALQEKKKKISEKVTIVAKLIANKTGPAKMLDELATIMTVESKRVWLTSLKQKNDLLTLEGGAMDHEDISEFQLALERRDTFNKVVLKRVSTQGDKDVQYLTWGLTCATRYKN